MCRRSFIVSILFCMSTFYGKSQNTYSKLYPLKPYPAANFNAVLVTDTAYFMTGVVSDSVPPYHPKPIFVRTDIDGNIQVVKMYKDGNKNYETWHQGMYFDDNGNIVTNGYIFNNPNKKENFFIRYRQTGEVDTIIELDYSLSNIDVNYSMLKDKENNFIIPVNSNPNWYATNVFFKLDRYGNVIDKKTYNPNNGNLLLIRMDTTVNGFILGGWQAPAGQVKNGIHQTIIAEFDTFGNKIWEYESPNDEDWTGTLGGIAVNDNDEIIYVSGKGYEFDSFAISDVFKNKWYATKIGRDKKIIWRTLFPTYADNSVEGSRFWNILKLKDRNYLSMGMIADSMTGIYSWITKFSDDGEILWNRNYKMESDTNGYQYEIRDIAEDTEGNLIAVGERIDLVRQGFNTQQALIMKLDIYGCLTPGCHLVNTKDDHKDLTIKIYPNPASEFITFYIDDEIKLKVNQYCIIDMSGQLNKEIKPLTPDIQYIIHTHDFSTGMYILQFLKNEHIVWSEKFIISH